MINPLIVEPKQLISNGVGCGTFLTILFSTLTTHQGPLWVELTPWPQPQRTAGIDATSPFTSALMKVGSPPFCGPRSLRRARPRPGTLPESKLAGGAGRPGDTLRFASVTVGDGEALCRDAERLMTEMVTRLEPVSGRSAIDLGRSTTAI
jgi:hypothetical protein